VGGVGVCEPVGCLLGQGPGLVHLRCRRLEVALQPGQHTARAQGIDAFQGRLRGSAGQGSVEPVPFLAEKAAGGPEP
jgi:hypothetical protein